MPESTQKQGVPKGDRRGVFRQGGSAPRVGLYARVSTHDQQTLPLQLSAMREHAERRGWAVVLDVEDVGSGVRDRPKRDDLMRAARRRELDLILVWRLDRWGRSLVDLVTTLQELTALRVGFVSLGEALDLTTPSGRALAGMLAVFAEFERDILRDRVKAGIAQARKEGRPHGRPRTIARHEAEVKRLSQEGVSKREIAKRTGISRASCVISSETAALSVQFFPFRGVTPVAADDDGRIPRGVWGSLKSHPVAEPLPTGTPVRRPPRRTSAPRTVSSRRGFAPVNSMNRSSVVAGIVTPDS